MNHTSLAMESNSLTQEESEALNREIVTAFNSELRLDLPETKGMMAVGFGYSLGLTESTFETVEVAAELVPSESENTVTFDAREVVVKSAAVFAVVFTLMLLGFQGAIRLQKHVGPQITEVAAR